VDTYRLNDLKITIDKQGANRYTKASYPVRYGKFCEIKTPQYLFQYSKGAIYLSPLNTSRNRAALLRRFVEIKNKSRLPAYLYLIQRL
jgi:hypothetical protein